MARKISIDCPPIPKKTDPHGPGILHKTYDIKLITPLFGGGVEAGQNDPTTLIRPPSIRGHLRFWWRATRGAACKTVKELRQREAEVWGSTEIPSPVSIQVDVNSRGAATPCAKYAPNPKKNDGAGGYDFEWLNPFDAPESHIPYALFPFQGKARIVKSQKILPVTHLPHPSRSVLTLPRLS